MKIIKNRIVQLVLMMIVLTTIVSCNKSKINSLDEENNTNNPTLRAQLGETGAEKINIWRNKKWGIHMTPDGCTKGRGLCISGDYPPSNYGEYEGAMSPHPDNDNQLILYFTDEFIEDEDELIIDGFLIIDEPTEVFMDLEIAEYLGFNFDDDIIITFKEGEYEIINVEDLEGWNSVTIDYIY
jgi:hypothetical protein